MDFLLVFFSAALALSGPFWAYERFFFSKKRVVFGATPWGIRRLAPWFPFFATALVAKILFIEPYQVPSGSMKPNLPSGSLILASKWDYNLRLPFLDKDATVLFAPQRGDVALFIHPEDGGSVFIKRVAALPGEAIEIGADGELSIDGVPLRREPSSLCAKMRGGGEKSLCHEEYKERWGDQSWRVWQLPEASKGKAPSAEDPAFWSGCESKQSKKHASSIVCIVPPGHYFMLGDNRSESLDSRYWGPVPQGNFLAKARFAFSFSALMDSGWIR